MQQSRCVRGARVAASLALVLLLSLNACGRSPDRGLQALDRMSNQGVPVPVRSNRELKMLRRATVNPRTLHLIAEREGVSVLTARSIKQGPCFLTGARGGIGLTVCGRNQYRFPSSHLPVINLTTLKAKAGDRHPRIAVLAGLAADGVARVAVRFADGSSFFVPVVENAYIDSSVPQRPAVSIIGLDAQGHQLIAFPLPVPSVRLRTPPPES